MITERGNVANPSMRAALGAASSLEWDGWVVVGRWTEGQLHILGVVRDPVMMDDVPVRPVADQAAALGLRLVATYPDRIWSGVLEWR